LPASDDRFGKATYNIKTITMVVTGMRVADAPVCWQYEVCGFLQHDSTGAHSRHMLFITANYLSTLQRALASLWHNAVWSSLSGECGWWGRAVVKEPQI